MTNGERGGVAASSATEMAAFDSLDARVRDLLNYATLNYSAVQMKQAPKGGARFIGSIPVSEPDEQGQLIAAILRRENCDSLDDFRSRVARATLRPVARGRTFFMRSRGPIS